MSGPVVVTLVVRDEVDVVGACVDYHLARGADLVLATDHDSRDGTTDVLRGFERAGALRLFRERGPFAQGLWVTRMARRAAVEHGAAWVVHTDADEFWWPASGSLRAALAGVPAGAGTLVVPRSNLLPTRDERGPFWRRMTVRDRRSENALGEPLPPKVCHRGCADVTVADGNHTAVSPRLGEPVLAGTLEVLHYPARAWAQLERKVLQGARALAANTALPPAVGLTWRTMERWHAEGRLRRWYDEQVAAGEALPDGRRVRDERLKQWLAARAPAAA